MSSLSYYIYAYLRHDGTPYYIGKGKGRRAYMSAGRHTSRPKEKYRIIIIENKLTEVGALALERFYIRWYGRKDIGTGILRNKTDGGDGTYGHTLTTETRQIMSEKRKKRITKQETREKLSKAGKGRIVSDITKLKIANRLKKKVLCINNGVLYESMKAAGLSLSLHPANITQAIKENRTTSGYKFVIIT